MTVGGKNGAENKAPQGAFSAPAWDLGERVLTPAGRPLVMGIVNLTPDSFWSGSRAQGVEAAVAHALRLVAEGADLLDLGAESSRPGAQAVSTQEEQDRLLPVLEALRRQTEAPITVDTIRASTARQALAGGADAVNDISAATDEEMLAEVARQGCGLILMHMQGTPGTMQEAPRYREVVADVSAYLEERVAQAVLAGIPEGRLVVDPGIGFGKTLEHNLALLRGLAQVGQGRPLLLGASRKSFIGQLTGAETGDRLPGSLAALAAAYRSGASLVRVHDVAASVQFLDVLAAVSP
nr:dihydropteroate synthase [Candidatus Krumholzibacteria bacterium]